MFLLFFTWIFSLSEILKVQYVVTRYLMQDLVQEPVTNVARKFGAVQHRKLEVTVNLLYWFTLSWKEYAYFLKFPIVLIIEIYETIFPKPYTNFLSLGWYQSALNSVQEQLSDISDNLHKWI